MRATHNRLDNSLKQNLIIRTECDQLALQFCIQQGAPKCGEVMLRGGRAAAQREQRVNNTLRQPLTALCNPIAAASTLIWIDG
jgi:hypothetical protein